MRCIMVKLPNLAHTEVPSNFRLAEDRMYAFAFFFLPRGADVENGYDAY